MVGAYTAFFGKDNGAMLFRLFDEDIGDSAAGVFKIDVLVFKFHIDAIIAYAE